MKHLSTALYPECYPQKSYCHYFKPEKIFYRRIISCKTNKINPYNIKLDELYANNLNAQIMRKQLKTIAALILLMTSFITGYAQQGGTALSFDGSNDYVSVPHDASLNFTSFTVEAWVKPNAIQGCKIIGKTSASSAIPGFSMGLADNVLFCQAMNSWSTNVSATSTDAIPVGVWSHIAMSWSSGGYLKGYINGKEVINVSSGSFSITNTNKMIIGMAPWDNLNQGQFNGKMDEVRVWNDIRTQDEIKANMHRELAGTESGLVAYYKMSNGSGTTLTDNSGNGRTGTLNNGPSWVLSGCFAGPRNCLDFDGTNDYVDCGSPTATRITNNLTISAWVKTSLAAQRTYLTNQWYSFNSGILLGLNSSGKIHIAFCQANNNWDYHDPNFTVSDGKWHNIVVTFSSGNLKTYVDGILIDSYTSSKTSITYNGTAHLNIGRDSGSTEEFWSGSIDEVSIWNQVLTVAEIRENMAKSLSGNETGLVAYYRMDYSDGTTLYDITSNAINGTLTSMDAATDWVASNAYNTWIGGENSSWSTTANWSNGVPTSAQSVGIYKWDLGTEATLSGSPSFNSLLISEGASPTISSNFTASGALILRKDVALYGGNTLTSTGSLLIESGKSLYIPYDGQLTVSGTLSNETGSTGLEIGSWASGTGSLINGTTNVPATVNRYITGSSNLTQMTYHLASVPLTAAASPTSNLFIGSYLFDFDVANNEWVALGTSTTTPLDVTKGYMVYYPDDSNIYQFIGNLNAGTFSPTVIHAGSGYNLIPNPYPSAIDWSAATGWTKTNINDAIYIWPSGGSNYATYVGGVSSNGGSRYIPLGQAFFVKTNASSPVLTMTDNVRVHNTQAFFKNDETIPDLLRIHADANGYSDETVVRFTPEATTNADGNYDAWKMKGLNKAPQIYTETIDGNRLSINSLPYDESAYTVPLDFEFKTIGNVTLTFTNQESFASSVNIYLKDELANQTINLRNQPNYTFAHDTLNQANRFKLIFGGTIGIDDPATKASKIWVSGNTLYINASELAGEKALVEIFNTTGQQVYFTNLTLSELTTMKLNLTGLVIVRIATFGKVITTKGIIN